MRGPDGKDSSMAEERRPKHSKHHTKKHMDFMTKRMMDGSTFTQAHKGAMKKVGE